MSRFLTFSALLWAAVAAARDGAAARAEANRAVAQILSGSGVESATARLKYLGQQHWAVERLAAAAKDEPELRARRDAATALAALVGPGDERYLDGLLTDADGAIRLNALRGLSRTRPRLVAPMLPLLEDPSASVRREAAHALGAAHDRSVGKVLMAAVRKEEELEVRVELLAAAGASGDRSQASGLAAYLESSSEGTRFAAARGLCLLGDSRGAAAAHKLLSSTELDDREQGLALLDGAPLSLLRPLLRPLLQSKDAKVAARSARLLHQAGEPRMVEYLVLASEAAQGADKRPYEDEIEEIGVDTPVRKAILERARSQR